MEMIFICVVFGVFGATDGSFKGPSNAATVSGESVVFNCSTGSASRLRWSTKGFGHYGEQQILTRENRILPNFESQYFVESINDQLNLGIKKVTSSHAGRYICLELKTSNTASAELTVLESKPICRVDRDPFDIQCDASYKGTLVPEFELKLQTINDNSRGRLNRRLTLGADVLRSLNLSCVVGFSENGTKSARLSPENENGVTGTVAGNAPSLVSATECEPLTSSTSSTSIIAGVRHFELVAVALSSVVYRLSEFL